MKFKALFLFVTGTAVLALLFQNCSGSLEGGGEPAPSVTPDFQNDLVFSQGQAYDPSLIPFELTDQAAIDAANGYSERPDFKAMAFTEDGGIYVASDMNPLIVDQAEWNRVVLERCQLSSMNKACALFASGDVIAQDAEVFATSFSRPITVPTQFDGNLLPGMIDYWKNYLIPKYPDFSTNSFKGFAVGPNGGGQTGWSQVSQAEATRRTLEICESLGNTPCTLYAEGMNVVFDLENYTWEQQRVFYAPRAFNVDEIPFITESLREIIRTEYNQAVADGDHFGLALGRYGTHERITSNSPINGNARRDLVDACSAKITPPDDPAGRQRTCFLYSIDDQVEMTRQEFVDTSL